MVVPLVFLLFAFVGPVPLGAPCVARHFPFISFCKAGPVLLGRLLETKNFFDLGGLPRVLWLRARFGLPSVKATIVNFSGKKVGRP